jgi:hypothetical protein
VQLKPPGGWQSSWRDGVLALVCISTALVSLLMFEFFIHVSVTEGWGAK